ncbi:MAG: nitroreductase family protein [Acidobacteria bacterium]|nr:nitroreductase family protein [Acidobacteriota bacterium]MBI3488910.1 nitroreductase family protein [Acidobacteriota bacterium]
MPLPTVPYHVETLSDQEHLARAQRFYELVNQRRTVREFSDRPIPDGVLEQCLLAAGTAPSGAHKQPWRFVVVQDPAVKKAIREAAEKEEHDNYEWRMSEAWKRDLEPLGTDEHKPFLEIAPALVVVMALKHGDAGPEAMHYYVQESVGIATGMLISAIHAAGLATLTHTPSPMGFLQKVLNRPSHERPFVLLPVGYPAEGCQVPDLHRKSLDEISVWL